MIDFIALVDQSLGGVPIFFSCRIWVCFSYTIHCSKITGLVQMRNKQRGEKKKKKIVIRQALIKWSITTKI
jgi:hypothetical protein